MKLILTTLNSKYVHSNLALKYLYMAGKPYCPQLELKEFTVNNSRDYIFTELVAGDYDAVCFSCYIWNIEKILDLALDLKKAKPEIRILLGGPEVSYDAISLMTEHTYLDFILPGEGEASFGQWCRAMAGEWAYEHVGNLVYRRGNTIVSNMSMECLSFKEPPFPYRDFPCERDKVIYYEASRGCPFHCSYCISSLDKQVRHMPVAQVQEHLGYFVQEGVRQVKFLDRTFNWDRQRSLELFHYMMKIDQGQTNFHLEICADLLDDEMLDVLKEARKGLFQFEIGIQSTNERTLQAVDRTGSAEKILNNVKTLVAMGNSHIHVDLIAGLPFEDYKTFRNSFNDVYALGADNLQLGFLKMLKGTKIRAEAEQYGYLYMSRAPYEVISNRFMKAGELCRLKRIEELLDLYHNRGGFEGALSRAIALIKGTPFDFYEAFAEFYYSCGFQHRSHKKEDLYRIFYEFARKTGWGEPFQDILQQDLEQTMNFDAVKKFKRKGWNIL